MPELADFVGRWRFSRRLEGAGPGHGQIFDGIARFRPVPQGLHYEEACELRLNGRAGQMLWQRQGAGADLYLADGSHFHHLGLVGPVATAWHEADGISDELSYNFTHWPRWRAIWRRKDVASDTTMITDYRR